MRAHGGARIAERRAVLDGHAVMAVGVVARPELRRVVEPARVEAAAACGAALDQQVGVALHQALEHIVQAQVVVVDDAALIRGGVRVDVDHAAVEVPLEVLDVALVEHRAQLGEDVLAHVFAREVEYELVAAERGRFARHGERPVGMRAVQVGVLVDHLRLHPDAELDAERVDLLDELGERAAELLLVDRPVAERAEVVVAVAEPAVVHDEHVHAQVGGLGGKAHELVAGEVEVMGLPAVHEHGARGVAPRAAADVPADAAVQVVGEALQARARVGHDDLGRHELVAGLQRIGEQLVGKAHLHADLLVLGLLDLGLEVSAVHERHGPGAARRLGGIAVAQDHERVVLVRGLAATAADGKGAGKHVLTAGLALHAVLAVEGDDVEAAVDEVQAGALQLLDGDAALAAVLYDGGAADDVDGGQHAVQQLDLEAQPLVGKRDGQRLGVVCVRIGVGGGQAGERVLAAAHLVARVAQVAAEGALGVADDQQRAAQVAVALERELLGQDVERIGAALDVMGRRAAAAAVGERGQIGHLALAARTVVQVREVPDFVDLHLVGRV